MGMKIQRFSWPFCWVAALSGISAASATPEQQCIPSHPLELAFGSFQTTKHSVRSATAIDLQIALNQARQQTALKYVTIFAEHAAPWDAWPQSGAVSLRQIALERTLVIFREMHAEAIVLGDILNAEPLLPTALVARWQAECENRAISKMGARRYGPIEQGLGDLFIRETEGNRYAAIERLIPRFSDKAVEQFFAANHTTFAPNRVPRVAAILSACPVNRLPRTDLELLERLARHGAVPRQTPSGCVVRLDIFAANERREEGDPVDILWRGVDSARPERQVVDTLTGAVWVAIPLVEGASSGPNFSQVAGLVRRRAAEHALRKRIETEANNLTLFIPPEALERAFGSQLK